MLATTQNTLEDAKKTLAMAREMLAHIRDGGQYTVKDFFERMNQIDAAIESLKD